MIPSINDVFAADAAALIDTYGEPALYRPKNGDPRPVTVLVKRMGISASPPRANSPRPWMLITFKTDPNAGGIDPATFDPEGDKIDLAYVAGGVVQTFGFTKDFPLQTPGRLKVRVV